MIEKQTQRMKTAFSSVLVSARLNTKGVVHFLWLFRGKTANEPEFPSDKPQLSTCPRLLLAVFPAEKPQLSVTMRNLLALQAGTKSGLACGSRHR